MKVNQTIKVNNGKAKIKATENQADPLILPDTSESLSAYLSRNGVNVSRLSHLLQVYTESKRNCQAQILLELTEIEDVISAFQRGDMIEATEIFVSFCLKTN